MNNKQKFSTIALTAMLVVLAQFTMVAQNDRVTFGLKGNVTKVIQDRNSFILPFSGSELENYDWEFSKSGKLIKVNENIVEVENSDRGEENIILFRGDEDEIGGDEVYYVVFFYRDAKGRLSSIYYMGLGTGCDTVIYDSKGRVSQIVVYSYQGDEGGFKDWKKSDLVESSNIKYFYDEKNNLIKAVLYDLDEKKSYSRTYKYESFDKTGNWLTRVVNCEKDDIKNAVETRTVEY
jgi:hypothetical protein